MSSNRQRSVASSSNFKREFTSYNKPNNFKPDGNAVYVGQKTGMDKVHQLVVTSVQIEFLRAGTSLSNSTRKKNHVIIRLNFAKNNEKYNIGGRKGSGPTGLRCSVEPCRIYDNGVMEEISDCFLEARPIHYTGQTRSSMASFDIPIRTQQTAQHYIEIGSVLFPFRYSVVEERDGQKYMNGCRDFM